MLPNYDSCPFLFSSQNGGATSVSSSTNMLPHPSHPMNRRKRGADRTGTRLSSLNGGKAFDNWQATSLLSSLGPEVYKKPGGRSRNGRGRGQAQYSGEGRGRKKTGDNKQRFGGRNRGPAEPDRIRYDFPGLSYDANRPQVGGSQRMGVGESYLSGYPGRGPYNGPFLDSSNIGNRRSPGYFKPIVSAEPTPRRGDKANLAEQVILEDQLGIFNLTVDGDSVSLRLKNRIKDFRGKGKENH